MPDPNLLSRLEQEIANLYGAGTTLQEIAAKLKVTPETVRLHLASIEYKLTGQHDPPPRTTADGKFKHAT